MFKLKIRRFKDGYDWTIGIFELYNDIYPVYTGFTLEPAGQDTTIPNQDKRIPAGIYTAEFKPSPRFGLVPVLYNDLVPESRRILIHVGNEGKNTEGCILLGSEWKDGFIYNSKATITKVFEKLAYRKFLVEIINDIK